MLVETENLVSADAFRRDFDRFVEVARQGLVQWPLRVIPK
jgi:hypothetical protein